MEGEHDKSKARISAEFLLQRWNAEIQLEYQKEKKRHCLYPISWISVVSTCVISNSDLSFAGYLLPYTAAAAYVTWISYTGLRMLPRSFQEDLSLSSDQLETEAFFREAHEGDRLIKVMVLTLGIILMSFMSWIL